MMGCIAKFLMDCQQYDKQAVGLLLNKVITGMAIERGGTPRMLSRSDR